MQSSSRATSRATSNIPRTGSKDKRWRQHVTKPVAAVDPQKVLEERAKDIQARKPWARTIKASQAGECILAGLVTADQLPSCGDQRMSLAARKP